MFKVTFKLPSNPSALVQKGAAQGVADATKFMQKAVRKETPELSGRLVSSISSEVSGLSGIVFQNPTIAPYGAWVHDGTGIYGPHGTPIIPTTKKYLSWVKNGTRYFRLSVAGQKANPYMKRAYALNKKTIVKIISKAISAVLEGWK
jgi:hypothetical protein